MRTTIIAVILSLCALPASAQDIRGQWHLQTPSKPDYMGTIMVDTARRATWDDAYVKMVGYVLRADALRATIVLTDREEVVHMQCALKSSDLMHCYNFLDNGGITALFKVVRVGPGPKTLTRAPQ